MSVIIPSLSIQDSRTIMPDQSNTMGIFACGSCHAKYARVDHLIRHVRSHTKERPFTCSACGKAFGRQDLLKRHIATHNASSNKDADAPSESTGQNGRQSQRVHQACRLCAEKKLKCTDEKPCQRCNEKNLVCEYESAGNPSTAQRKPTDASEPHTAEAGLSAGTLVGEEDSIIFDDTSTFQGEGFGGSGELISCRPSSPDPVFNLTRPIPPADNIPGSTMNLPVWGDFVHFDSDLALEDMDLSFLNEMSPSMLPSPPREPELAPTIEHATIAVGTEAYKHSSALAPWNPSKGDNHAVDEQDLVLPNNVNPSTHSPQFSAHQTIEKQEISVAARDQILAMILRNTSRAGSNRIVCSFPSIEVLSDLILHACIHMKGRQSCDFVHVPSINLNRQRPHLLCALIAYGATCSQALPVRKFGYALQETVRVAIDHLVSKSCSRVTYANYVQVEEEHSALRELGVAQAFYIQLHLGYYSGINRKIEMAEGNSMLGLTMLRRGKRLRTDQYCAPEALLNSSALSTEQKWLQWVEQESTKRLVYFAMSLDFHVAAARRINALFSCDEMGTPLPTCTDLWRAANAADWLTGLNISPTLKVQQPLPLNRVLRQPQLFAVCKAVTDLKFAAFAYLAGSWALIEDYWRMTALTPLSQHTNDFVLHARHTELLSTVERFRSELTDQSGHGAEIFMLQELVFLHLNVSYNHIVYYCGQGSEDDARTSTPYIEQWFDSPQSRTAIWHAAQVFRAAKQFSVCALADIYVIGLYQAAQILWVWSLLSRMQPPKETSDTFSIILDDEETPQTMRFLKAGQGKPYLTDRSGIAFPLGHSAMIHDLAKDIISTNWTSVAMPLTTVETSRVLREFAKITRQRFHVGLPSDPVLYTEKTHLKQNQW